MGKGSRLSEKEQSCIYAFLHEKKTISYIADYLGRSRKDFANFLKLQIYMVKLLVLADLVPFPPYKESNYQACNGKGDNGKTYQGQTSGASIKKSNSTSIN
ncbi:hypothetical protein ENBRE01_3193 [Enteropsectra breve]|nr:hypothetical protein ENBRE01_3193 [Enteropsectra breve]